MDRRAFIVGAAASSAVVGRGAAQSAGGDGDEDFDPDVWLTPMQTEVSTDGDPPDQIVITTTDGTDHVFDDLTEVRGFFRGGYTGPGETGWLGEGWFGFLESVEVRRDGETIVAETDERPEWDLTCSLLEGYEDAVDLRISYENAHKHYDPPAGDGVDFGSPGRTIRSVEDLGYDWRIDLGDRECEPEAEPAVTFDCTSVTVEPDEFVNGAIEFYRPVLTFADGTSQRLGEDEERFEPPVTLEGSGDHEEKAIEQLSIWNDSGGEASFGYWNPDVDDCEPDQGSFDPDVTVDDITAQVRVDGDPPDEIVLRMADGSTHSVTEGLEADRQIRVGYTGPGEPGWIGEGWFGVIESVAVRRDDQTIEVDNDDPSDLDITCSLVENYDRASDLRVHYDYASKRYDPPVGDRPVYGSPGRVLRRVEEVADDWIIVLGESPCEPSDDPAVTFDCTSVTIEPEEFVAGAAEFYWPELRFADGETQRIGDRDRRFEPPETFAGTGEHEGKVIRSVHIWNDPGGESMFGYANPDYRECGSVRSAEGDGDVSTSADGVGGEAGSSTSDGDDSIEEGPSGGRSDGDVDQSGDAAESTSPADTTDTGDGAETAGDDAVGADADASNGDGSGLGGVLAVGGLGAVGAYLRRELGAEPDGSDSTD